MYDDEVGIIIAAFLIIGAWIIGIAMGDSAATPTELPNDCILYEEKIWCEVEE